MFLARRMSNDFESEPNVTNCTFSKNTAQYGAGIYCNNSLLKITNSIIWSNSVGSIYPSETLNQTVSYCDIQGGWAGEGNINTDPCFVNGGEGDYHLRPDSPCIDAGDPNSDFGLEPEPDGGRINIGYYGNTPEATSKYGLVLQSYNLVSRTRVGRTVFDYVYKMTLNNNSNATVSSVHVELLDAPANVSIIDNSVNFNYIGAGQSAISDDTFTIRVDRSVPVDKAIISWRAAINWVDGDSTEQMQMTSIPLGTIFADITGDSVINFNDLLILAEQWLQAPGEPSADIAPAPAGDGIVDFRDFALLAEHWLQ